MSPKSYKQINEKYNGALARQLNWLEHCPNTPRLQVRSPVRAHIEVTNECTNMRNNK